MLWTNNLRHFLPETLRMGLVLGETLREGDFLTLSAKNTLETLQSVFFLGSQRWEIMSAHELPKGGERVLVGERVEGKMLLGHFELETE